MTLSTHQLQISMQSRQILNNINLQLGAGQTIGLLGPNGSGKSTLLRCLAGLFPKLKQNVSLNGDTLARIPLRSLARQMAFVPQHAQADEDLCVTQIVRLGRTPHRHAFTPWSTTDEAAVEEAMRRMQLSSLRDRLWRQLSGGERQRCQIARALAQQPAVLLLDEPTNHLDIQHQLELMQLIASLSITVVIALHDLNLAANYCQQLILLKAGQVIATGAPEKVLTPYNIKYAWNVNAKVCKEDDGAIAVRYALS